MSSDDSDCVEIVDKPHSIVDAGYLILVSFITLLVDTSPAILETTISVNSAPPTYMV